MGTTKYKGDRKVKLKSCDVLSILFILTTTSLASTLIASRYSRAEQVRVYAGAEMFAIAPEDVTELDYETAKRKVSATRLVGTGRGFLIRVTGIRKTDHQQCRSGKAFDLVLKDLSSVRAKKILQAAEAAAIRRQYAGKAAMLRIREGPDIAVQVQLVVMEGADRGVILLDGPVTYESSLSRKFVDRLSHGCAALSATVPH